VYSIEKTLQEDVADVCVFRVVAGGLPLLPGLIHDVGFSDVQRYARLQSGKRVRDVQFGVEFSARFIKGDPAVETKGSVIVFGGETR
jgi:hypothetical protein